MESYPRSFSKAKTPICLACKYGKATRRPWRTKTEPYRIISANITSPGRFVSVDQLQSSTPGLVAQLNGHLTKTRYTAVTIFVDHFPRLTFIYLQWSSSVVETFESKKSFETYASDHYQNYHADNARFTDNDGVQHTKTLGQTMSYCGVEAHFYNRIAEKTIRDLQDQARTALLRAQHH